MLSGEFHGAPPHPVLLDLEEHGHPDLLEGGMAPGLGVAHPSER